MTDVLFPGGPNASDDPGDDAPGDPDEAPRCSSKGCRSAAAFDLRWRNPRLHDAARVKHWLACAEHADSLADYLSARSFLLSRGPLEPRH